MLKYVENKAVLIDRVDEFIVCGDPGCDGYNGTAVAIYEHILRKKSNLTFVVGDMVPNGHSFYYDQFKDITNTSAKNPVYCVVGNHDIKNYEEYLGHKNYYIKSENTLFIILDNSKRYFDEETYTFLKDTLDNNCNCPTFVFFHIPPPNEYVDNTIATQQWDKLKANMENYKNHIECIFAGHVHKALDFELDGYRVVVTGGAGSNPDEIFGKLNEHEHHYYKVKLKSEKWEIKRVDMHYKELGLSLGEGNLTDGFIKESTDYITYKLYAQQAELEGYNSVSKLFRALAESEMIHARNMLIADGKVSDTMTNLSKFYNSKKKQSLEEYPEYIKKEKSGPYRSAYISFDSALMAEKMHVKLIENAMNSMSSGGKLEEDNYYICQRCGYVHAGDSPIRLCPACGTSKYFFKLF